MEEIKQFQHVNKKGMTFWKDSISLELIQINHSPHEDFMPEKDGDNVISYKRNIWEQVDQEWLKCFVS